MDDESCSLFIPILIYRSLDYSNKFTLTVDNKLNMLYSFRSEELFSRFLTHMRRDIFNDIEPAIIFEL